MVTISMLQALSALSCLTPHVLSGSAPLPDVEVAKRDTRAAHIFNSIHSALRQWGSSIQHNGLSFLPVTIPEGNIFYHGTHSTERPAGLEWLAFEMEHANLAPDDDDDGGHKRPGPPEYPPDQRGYFHTYRAARPLNLVYIDGMAAAKCGLGTLDSQDFILNDFDTQRPPGGMQGEIRRSTNLCKLAKEWDVDGWIRMEAGFEIIYCDFSEGAGLDLVSVHGSPWRNETGSSKAPVGGDWIRIGSFEWMRAVAERYHGHVQGRALIDFSGMVSAFAYDINVTNFDETRPELPRVVNSTREERQGIRARLSEVMKTRNGRAESSVDWQRVVDAIVSRYSHRLWILAQANLTVSMVRSEIATLTYPFLSFPDDAPVEEFSNPLARCTEHFLLSVAESEDQWTPEDHAIHAAIQTVSHIVCQALFEMRQTIHTLTDASDEETAVQRTQNIAQNLTTQLDWTTWKECGRCEDPLALCFVAMFPIGGPEDHFAPRCKRLEEMAMGYFFDRSGRPEKPPTDDKRQVEVP
ncbi:hypothetical protein DL546_007556 [Coniochaeta pulveracea]|uniref:Uncharacterized protein n=1 Tax=Coniochaeta pulveracea TaxID=177199 RepID=A0A420YGJ0_9PEZI|nr:hypothetical protein DL546_007556 [Coniochaeta pulveracea]